MSEILVAPDAAALMIAWLTQQLPTIPQQSAVGVHRAVPDQRPTSFVTVRLLPGAGRDDANPVVDRPALAIEAWGPSAAAAHDLAQNARAVAHAAKGVVHGGVQVYRVDDVSAPADLPDPLSDQPRCTFTVQLTVRIRRP